MSAFAQWLMGFLDTFVVWIYNAFIDLFQIILDVCAEFGLNILKILPTADGIPTTPINSKITWSDLSLYSPTYLNIDPSSLSWFTGQGGSTSSTVFNVFIDSLNWLAPVAYVYEVAKFSTFAMLIYICIAPVLRWFKILT